MHCLFQLLSWGMAQKCPLPGNWNCIKEEISNHWHWNGNRAAISGISVKCPRDVLRHVDYSVLYVQHVTSLLIRMFLGIVTIHIGISNCEANNKAPHHPADFLHSLPCRYEQLNIHEGEDQVFLFIVLKQINVSTFTTWRDFAPSVLLWYGTRVVILITRTCIDVGSGINCNIQRLHRTMFSVLLLHPQKHRNYFI